MDVKQWLQNLIGTDSMRSASAKVGYAQTTIQRQMEKGSLSPEMVIALCRSYGRSPITGLIENGYIHEHETDGIGIEYALRKATNQQILDEILKRSDPEARLLFTNDADPNVIDLAEDPVEFNPASVTHIDDLSHVRGSRYAADRRMREPQEGDDDYGSGA